MQLLIDTEHIHTPLWPSSLCPLQKIANTHLSLFCCSLSSSFPCTKVLRGPVNSACLHFSSSPSPPLSILFHLSSPLQDFILFKRDDSSLRASAQESLSCLSVLRFKCFQGLEEDREVRASGGGRWDGGKDREERRPVQFLSSRVAYESPPSRFTSAPVLYVVPQPSLWSACTCLLKKRTSL